MNSYPKRYADNWLSEIVPKAHKACRGICVHCHRRPSKNIHHARYQDAQGNRIAGRERVDNKEGSNDAYGLCEECHKQVAHSSKNWVRSRTNPELENRNTDEFAARLQLGLELIQHVL